MKCWAQFRLLDPFDSVSISPRSCNPDPDPIGGKYLQQMNRLQNSNTRISTEAYMNLQYYRQEIQTSVVRQKIVYKKIDHKYIFVGKITFHVIVN